MPAPFPTHYTVIIRTMADLKAACDVIDRAWSSVGPERTCYRWNWLAPYKSHIALAQGPVYLVVRVWPGVDKVHLWCARYDMRDGYAILNSIRHLRGLVDADPGTPKDTHGL